MLNKKNKRMRTKNKKKILKNEENKEKRKK